MTTRVSTHTARVRLVNAAGVVTETGEAEATLNLDESLSPYGDADAAVTFTPTVEQATDPIAWRGLRMMLELSESVGDPVTASEITAQLGGSVAAITARFGPALTPAKITSTYFVAWNPADVRPGGGIRANLIVTSRDIDYREGVIRFTAATDEALLAAYKLVSTVAETSGALTVRATVNYALGKVGATLLPGPDDAPIAEPEANVWEPGTSAWDYVRGVAEAAGLVVRCDERRRWTLTQRGVVSPESVGLSAFAEASQHEDLDSETWADAVVMKYSWTDALGALKVKYDTAALTADPIKVVTVERDTPYPGAGGAAYWLNRLRARGKVYQLESVGDYSIRPGWGFTASLPDGTASAGFVEAITWACPSDRGTIRTRGAADVAKNAIDLFPTGLKIDQLTGKIDALTVGGV